MGRFYVRVDVRSHVNNGPLNNTGIVRIVILVLCALCGTYWYCMYVALYCQLMFTHKPVREPDLSNPFQGLFFWPGFLRGFLRGFWLFLPPP